MINLDNNKQVASISGGRTSHYMISVLLEKYGKDKVDFVFCDTGAEHQGTYDFVKDTSTYFDIEITHLRMHMPKEEGKGCEYVVVQEGDIKSDYKPFQELMQKYGRPFNPGGKFCTDQMKTQIYRKYCKDTYGKGNYTTWIGYRDEPKDSSRVFGHTLSGTLSKWFDITQRDQGEFYKDCCEALKSSVGGLVDFVNSNVNKQDLDSNYKRVLKVVDRVVKNHELGYRFCLKSQILISKTF